MYRYRSLLPLPSGFARRMIPHPFLISSSMTSFPLQRCFSQTARVLAVGGGPPNAGRTFNRFQQPKKGVSGTKNRVHSTSHSSSSGSGSKSTRALTERLTASSYSQKKAFRPKLHPNEEVPHGATSDGTASKDRRRSNLTARSSLRGRFNRVAAERGFAFASLLYIVGECMTLSVTLFLHWGYLGQYADIRYWLGLLLLGCGGVGATASAVGSPSDLPKDPAMSNGAAHDTAGVGVVTIPDGSGSSGHWFMDFLEMGPMLWDEADLRLSPRLLFHYGIANMMLWPLYRYQVAFCEMALPVMSSLRAYVVRNLRLDKLMPGKASRTSSSGPSASAAAETTSKTAESHGGAASKSLSSSISKK